jgi:hypothetical protein
VTDDNELQRMDRLLDQLGNILSWPGDEGGDSPEWTWQKVDQLYESMGAEALRALLRRQGMSHATIDEVIEVLDRRRSARA